MPGPELATPAPPIDHRSPGACLACASRLVGLCAPLHPDLLEQVARQSTRGRITSGDTIFHQGDPAREIVSVVDGAVRLVRLLPDGRRAAIGFRFAGDLIGFTAGREHAFSAEAMTDATICRLDRRHLEQFLHRHPVIEARMLDLCMRELAATQDHLLVLGRFSAEERVAAFLVSLAEAQKVRRRSEVMLDLPATRADLGDLLGLTLETVSRVFSAFRRRGLIRLHGIARVELLAPDRLHRLAHAEGSDAGA
jgi:CRP/FNR family transcriptional regulator